MYINYIIIISQKTEHKVHLGKKNLSIKILHLQLFLYFLRLDGLQKHQCRIIPGRCVTYITVFNIIFCNRRINSKIWSFTICFTKFFLILAVAFSTIQSIAFFFVTITWLDMSYHTCDSKILYHSENENIKLWNLVKIFNR